MKGAKGAGGDRLWEGNERQLATVKVCVEGVAVSKERLRFERVKASVLSERMYRQSSNECEELLRLEYRSSKRMIRPWRLQSADSRHAQGHGTGWEQDQ